MSYQKLNMLPQAQLLEVVKQSPFASLEDEEAIKAFGLSEYCLAHEGESIRSADTPASAMFLIVSGSVRLLDAKQRTQAHFGEGDCIGMLSLVFPGHVAPEIVADKDTAFLFLDAVSYRMICLSDAKLAISMLRCIQTTLTPLINNAANALAKICE